MMVEDPREVTVAGVTIVLRDDDDLRWLARLRPPHRLTRGGIADVVADAGYAVGADQIRSQVPRDPDDRGDA